MNTLREFPDFMSQKVHQFASIFMSGKEEKQNREVSRFDAYLENVYEILAWKDTTITLSVFWLVNIIFLAVVHWQVKLFGVIFLAILIGFVWDLYFQNKYADNYRLQYSDILDEFYTVLYDAVTSLKAFRKESPSSFCIGMSIAFLLMSFIARNISGYLFTYLSLLALFFLPLGYKWLPEEYAERLDHIFRIIISGRGVLAEEELMPFISGKDFNGRDPELDSLLTDRTADSVTNSLTSGMTSMPSYLDVENSRDEIEEDDLLPIRPQQFDTPGELSSDSDSDHKGIHFDSAHFNGDSSSSEEENMYIKGLKFTKDVLDSAKEMKPTQEGFSGILSNVASMGGNLVANAFKSTMTNFPLERKNSSDSEFEIINSEDVEDKS